MLAMLYPWMKQNYFLISFIPLQRTGICASEPNGEWRGFFFLKDQSTFNFLQFLGHK
jgi:hypothetical protein